MVHALGNELESTLDMLYLRWPPVEASLIVLWLPFGAISRECEAEGGKARPTIQGQIG